jgi:hypothetical protein
MRTLSAAENTRKWFVTRANASSTDWLSVTRCSPRVQPVGKPALNAQMVKVSDFAMLLMNKMESCRAYRGASRGLSL